MPSENNKPPDTEPTMRLLARPQDTNFAGDIFGGWIMSQVDIAGSIVASRKAKGRVVTVAVKEIQFHKPVYVGDLVSCYATITKIGTTSITVLVEVYAERNPADPVCIKVTQATLTYVAVDADGKPRPVNQ
ncbi:MAG: acyl-CoA thioesterase [Gammaproteobacteria bacterium]|jgi:acyl-CoA thioesterase YciA